MIKKTGIHYLKINSLKDEMQMYDLFISTLLNCVQVVRSSCLETLYCLFKAKPGEKTMPAEMNAQIIMVSFLSGIHVFTFYNLKNLIHLSIFNKCLVLLIQNWICWFKIGFVAIRLVLNNCYISGFVWPPTIWERHTTHRRLVESDRLGRLQSGQVSVTSCPLIDDSGLKYVQTC